MTPEETEARLLAEWLATPAGTPPPEGLSLEVVAAVYAMRPDRAPAPRVSIEDVLARVESGPFAPVATATPAERAPLGAARRPVGAERPEPRPAPRPTRRAWWRSPLVGLGLTAALAAVIVIPAAGVWLGSGALEVAEEIARSEQAAPTASTPAAPEADTVARPNAVIPEAAPPADEKPAAVSAVESAANADKTARPAEGLLKESPAVTGADAPLGGSGSGGVGASAGGASAGDGGLRDVSAAEPAPPPAPSAGPGSAPVTPAAEEAVAVPELSGTGGRAKADASSDDEADGWSWGKESKKSASKDAAYDEDEDVSEERTTATRRESSSTKARSAPAPKKPAADSAPAPTAGAPQAQSASVDDGRAAAVPSDYRASWYTSRPDVAAVYAEAERLRAAGDVAGALAAYQGLIAGADTAAAQDAAWRAATLARQAGRSDALSLVERGLGRSAANTAFRSNLLVLKGDLLRERGNASGAAAAWAEAARLNAGR